MKKVLFTANLDSFFIKFLIPQLKYFKDNGYEVHVALKIKELKFHIVIKNLMFVLQEA